MRVCRIKMSNKILKWREFFIMELNMHRPIYLEGMENMPELREILTNSHFISMKNIRHHGNISCLEHTLRVAERSYKMCRGRKNIDVLSTVRSALLHDFYLYDKGSYRPPFHNMRHPKDALRNAEKFFKLNKIERDAIMRHMWPLTPIPPRYRESMIVSMADKRVAFGDFREQIQIQRLPKTG